jgi:acyl-CoA reductase-like NAD-dependent aldehyde dehydrogenase
MEVHPMYIGGEWIATAGKQTIAVPYDGAPAGEVSKADAALVRRAVDSAKAAARVMRRLSNCERAELLDRITALLRRDLGEFARLVALETGKPIREARGEAERSVQTLVASAQAARELRGEVVPIDAAPTGKGRLAITVREPLGVIGAITPFNFPLNLGLHKIAPALAAGNAVVHKPAGLTPLSALRLARTVEEAGAPPGAYNVVTGDGSVAGNALVNSPDVAMITFTGSGEVGLAIRARAGMKRVTLELGGNAALVLEPDCDLDAAVARAVVGSFAHSGQVCISIQRIYVHESIAVSFLEKFVAATGKLRIGHPLEETTDVSSLITEREAIRVQAWIAEAVDRGARLVAGGERRYATVTPAILTGVPPDVRICCQEVFGPVVVVDSYRTLEEAVEKVNDSAYGLQAGIYTRDIGRAFQAARRLEVGGVMINDIPTFRVDHMPYGGVKQSGTGREGPRYAVEEMSELKLICWRVEAS